MGETPTRKVIPRRNLVRFRYRIFGITLASEIPLPGLFPARNGKTLGVDGVRFEIDHSSFHFPKSGWTSFRRLRYWQDPGFSSGVLWSGQIGRFRFDFANRLIAWKPASNSSLSLTRILLQGRVLSFFLERQPASLLLHGSVVAGPQGAVILCGPMRQGKSTLTAALLDKQLSLVSDDVAYLQAEGNRFFLRAGVPEVRLWPDAARCFNPGGRMPEEALYPQTQKRRIPLGNRAVWKFHSQKVPLHLIYLLSRKQGGNVQIESIQGKQAMLALLQNLYNPFIKDLVHQQEKFARMAQLVERYPVKRLVYPTGLSRIPTVRKALLKDLDWSFS